MEIERGMADELSRLAEVGTSVGERLREIEFDFTRPEAQDEDVATELLAGGVVGAVGGLWFGGALSGSFAGYRAAGVKGAAVGGVSGAAVGIGTSLGLAVGVAALGLPITWMVALPILAVGGLAGAFSSRSIVRALFKEERVDRFREGFTEAVLAELKTQGPESVRALQALIDSQVAEAFAAIRKQVEAELGGAISSTRSTLDELRTQRARSAAQRERDLTELDRDAARAKDIERRARTLKEALRNTSTGATA
jgi:hypothetical protein